jgi:hypothetical protein
MAWRTLSQRAAAGFSPSHLHARPGATLGGNRKAFYSYYPLIGSAVLLLGVFCPTSEIVDGGTANILRDGNSLVGVSVLLLAVVSLVLAIKENYKWLKITGAASLLVVAYSFYYELTLIRLHSEAAESLDSIYRLLGKDDRLGPRHLEFAWGLLFTGAGLIFAASITKEPTEP